MGILKAQLPHGAYGPRHFSGSAAWAEPLNKSQLVVLVAIGFAGHDWFCGSRLALRVTRLRNRMKHPNESPSLGLRSVKPRGKGLLELRYFNDFFENFLKKCEKNEMKY